VSGSGTLKNDRPPIVCRIIPQSVVSGHNPPAMESPEAAVLAEPPRPITAQVRRRAWVESGVKLWWLSALALVLASLIVLGFEFSNWQHQKRLIEQSVIVDAKAYETNGMKVPGRNMAVEGGTFEVYFRHDGKDHVVTGPFEGRTGHIISGEPIQIRIDPADPTRWTARLEPPGFAMRLIGPSITLAPAIPLLLIAILKRVGVINLFRSGQQRTATVVNTVNTPLAPGSAYVRCALLDSDDRRVIQVLLPARYGRPGKGEEIELIVDEKDITRAVAAAPFIV